MTRSLDHDLTATQYIIGPEFASPGQKIGIKRGTKD